MSSMVVLLGIPFVMWLPKVHRFSPNMLKRTGIRLLVLVTQDIMYMAMLALTAENETDEDPINDQEYFILVAATIAYLMKTKLDFFRLITLTSGWLFHKFSMDLHSF